MLATHGLKLSLFFQELFADRISAFFGMDVLVSAIVLIVFVRVENCRVAIRRRWLPVRLLYWSGFHSDCLCSFTCEKRRGRAADRGKALQHEVKNINDRSSPVSTSVLRHFCIDALGPGVDAAGQVMHLAEAGLFQEVDGLGTAASHFAVDNDLARGVQFAHPLGQVI